MATPIDFQAVENLRSVVPDTVLVSARKGTFGHGMGAAGGWELTAQYLGYESGVLFPTPLARSEMNHEIGQMHQHFVFDDGCTLSKDDRSARRFAGKLSMGVGGVNACVVSRPWK